MRRAVLDLQGSEAHEKPRCSCHSNDCESRDEYAQAVVVPRNMPRDCSVDISPSPLVDGWATRPGVASRKESILGKNELRQSESGPLRSLGVDEGKLGAEPLLDRSTRIVYWMFLRGDSERSYAVPYLLVNSAVDRV
jgi:hypothetical protein